MKINQNQNTVIIDSSDSFNPVHIFECGQCFRWDRESDGSYTGVAFSKVINILTSENKIIIKNSTIDDFENIWKNYLDLNTDYSIIKRELSFDKTVKKAMDFGWGIRILNQDIFECLISFIISTQNSIPRIKKIVLVLCKMFGKKIEFDGKVYYTFPTKQDLLGITESDLEPLHAGYRAKYIVDAVNMVCRGEVDLDSVKTAEYAVAKKELMKINGVGPKVADCVLLFSANKKEAFPIDVWVMRTVRSLYLGNDAKQKQIEKFAFEHFGKYAGVAQQYLFYYGRENKIE